MKTSNAKFLNKLAFITTVAMVAGTAISAQAGSQTATMELSTEVVANCTISADALSVSGYDPIVVNQNTDFNQQTNVTVTCTNGSPVTIRLDDGQNVGRQLKFGTDNYLDYELFSDNARQNVWGNTELNDVATTGTGLVQTLPVYMQVPKNQNVPAGTYTDIVTATVTF